MRCTVSENIHGQRQPTLADMVTSGTLPLPPTAWVPVAFTAWRWISRARPGKGHCQAMPSDPFLRSVYSHPLPDGRLNRLPCAEDQQHRLARVSYTPDPDAGLQAFPNPALVDQSRPSLTAACGLVSTMDDYLRFARMLLNERRTGRRAHTQNQRQCKDDAAANSVA